MEANLEFMATMLFSGLVVGQPGVHWDSGLPWWVVMLPEDLTSASRRKELETFWQSTIKGLPVRTGLETRAFPDARTPTLKNSKSNLDP